MCWIKLFDRYNSRRCTLHWVPQDEALVLQDKTDTRLTRWERREVVTYFWAVLYIMYVSVLKYIITDNQLKCWNNSTCYKIIIYFLTVQMIHGLRELTHCMSQEILHFMMEPLNHCLQLQSKSTRLQLQTQSHKSAKQRETTTAKSH